MNVDDDGDWAPGELILYRWTPAESPYAPDSPWWGNARFDVEGIKSLYLAHSPEGAMAEFFRVHPELLSFQDELRVELFEISLNVNGLCLDVRGEVGRRAFDIGEERLRSNDREIEVRYLECRRLTVTAVELERVGIAYPSAATRVAGEWNLVLFGDPSATTWVPVEVAPVAIPRVDPSVVQLVEV